MSDLKTGLKAVGALLTAAKPVAAGVAEQSNASVQEAQERRHQRQQTPRIEGFVRCVLNAQGQLRLRDLYMPGYDRNGRVRNRNAFIDRSAPGWFSELCQKLAENNDPMEVRVRVRNYYTDSVAYVVPSANDERQVRLEWARRMEDTIRPRMARTLIGCRTPDEVAEFIYDIWAARHNCTMVHYFPSDSGLDAYTALVIKDNGIIVRLSGGENVWNYTDGIIAGTTSLDDEITKNVYDAAVNYIP